MKNILWVLLCVLALLLGYSWGQHSSPAISATTQQYVDTVYDTIPYYQPVPKDSTILRYKTITVPHVEHLTDTTNVEVYDTIQIPITQKEYEDSTYHAWVSGYEPNLDSIYVFPKTIIITRNNVQMINKRWGVELQVGMGYNGSKISPFVGIGISYNLWNF